MVYKHNNLLLSIRKIDKLTETVQKPKKKRASRASNNGKATKVDGRLKSTRILAGKEIDASKIRKSEYAGTQIVDKKTGRFMSKYTPDVVHEFLELAEQGYSLIAIAAKMNIHARTLSKWSEQHPELAAVWQLAKDKRQYAFEKKLVEANNAHEVTSAKFVLERVFPSQYGNAANIHLQEANVINSIDLNKLSVEELTALQAIVQRQAQQKAAIAVEYQEVKENDEQEAEQSDL